jgi:hypothetical protein
VLLLVFAAIFACAALTFACAPGGSELITVDTLKLPDSAALKSAADDAAPAFTSALAFGLFCTNVFTYSVTLVGMIIS